MDEKQYKEILSKYVPEPTVKLVFDWVTEYGVYLKITPSRRSKLGDYRPPIRQPFHRISINNDLNEYSFLITFIHELAHLKIWNKHQNRVMPHGDEWYREYISLLKIVMNMNVFPEDILIKLEKHIEKRHASSSSDKDLYRILKNYNSAVDHSEALEDLPLETVFATEDGRQFRKQEKLRKRYKCLCLNNNRMYLFQPHTPIFPVK
ncbi:MAG: hypothetical protein JEZ03_07350 [Bacteroidales bacterium]|nr:hypothetical protein [Bacteroidales bacterium]